MLLLASWKGGSGGPGPSSHLSFSRRGPFLFAPVPALVNAVKMRSTAKVNMCPCDGDCPWKDAFTVKTVFSVA